MAKKNEGGKRAAEGKQAPKKCPPKKSPPTRAQGTGHGNVDKIKARSKIGQMGIPS